MPKFTKVPACCGSASVQDMNAGEIEYNRLLLVPGWSMVGGPRRAALQAKMNSGFAITPLEYFEFTEVVKNYVPGMAASASPHGEAARRQRIEWEREENARKAAAPKRPAVIATLRDAQMMLSPLEYAAWCKANPGIVARELR